MNLQKKNAIILSRKPLNNISRPSRYAFSISKCNFKSSIISYEKPSLELLHAFPMVECFAVKRTDFITRYLSKKRRNSIEKFNNKIKNSDNTKYKLSIFEEIKVFFLVPFSIRKGEKKRDCKIRLISNGIFSELYQPILNIFISFSFMKKCKLILNKNKIKPHLIIAHDNYSLVAAYLISKKYKSKLIYDCVEDTTSRLHSNESIFKKIIDKIWFLIENYIQTRCNAITYVSSSLKLKKEKTHRPKLSEVIINKPILEWTFQSKEFDAKSICWIGSPYPAQGIEFIIDLSKIMKDYQFTLIGTPLPAWKIWYENLKFKAPKNVKFIEAVSPINLGINIKNFAAGIIPRDETLPNNSIALPNKFFEYLANGKPIISTEFHEFNRFIEKNDFGVKIFYKNLEKSKKNILKDLPRILKKNDIRDKIVATSLWSSENDKIKNLIKKLK